MTIQNPLVRDLVGPLLELDDEEVSWRSERWRDHLETVSAAEVDSLHQQILAEIDRFEGNDGPGPHPPREYEILKALYYVTAYVSDMHKLNR
ncbi:MAG: hypothetical protein ACAI44_34535 [Candidatus Sericytochromatia bacterium]